MYPLMGWRKEAARLFSALTAVISTPALGGKWSQADGCPQSGTNFSHRQMCDDGADVEEPSRRRRRR